MRDEGLPIVAGVDVGGRAKGFHAVALKAGGFLEKFHSCEPTEIFKWCRSIGASTVAVDAPCMWSLTGKRRNCENALSLAKLSTFATPTFGMASLNPFYGWMLNGAELYQLLVKHYQLFDGRHSVMRPVCLETFPHAAACALAGRPLVAKNKRKDRRRLLAEAGVKTEALKNIDEVDAGICALTAHLFLKREFKPYGNGAEGFIIVPKKNQPDIGSQ